MLDMVYNDFRIPPFLSFEKLRGERKEEFLKPLHISAYRLAKNTKMSAVRVGGIVRGKRAITAGTALRLSLFFGMSVQFWLNLQASYELDCFSAKEKEVRKEAIWLGLKFNTTYKLVFK